MTLNVSACRELIAHLKAQPEERFNMGFVKVMERHGCGAAGCNKGHMILCWPHLNEGHPTYDGFADFLGLNGDQWNEVVLPKDWAVERDGVRNYPLFRSIRMWERLVSHFEATGEIVVDWGPEPGDEPARPAWSPPVVIDQKPELPEWLKSLERGEAQHV